MLRCRYNNTDDVSECRMEESKYYLCRDVRIIIQMMLVSVGWRRVNSICVEMYV